MSNIVIQKNYFFVKGVDKPMPAWYKECILTHT